MINTSEYDDIKRRHAANVVDTKSSRAMFWSQLLALPDPEYIVKGVVDRGALVEIYGPPSSGKSFFACNLALHVAAGWNWHGHRVRPGGVLYIAAEGGVNIKRRLTAFAHYHNLDLSEVPIAVVLASTDLLTPEGVAQAIADAAAVPSLCLIVVDTASRVMPGGKEDTEDMGKLVAACDAIRAATGATVLVIHHTGKNADRGSRGSIVLPAAADTIIAVSDNNGARLATIEKARDGEIDTAFSFTLKVVPLGTDDDGDEITSCVVEQVEVAGKSHSAAKLTREEKGYLADITTYFAREESAISDVIPEPGSVAVRATGRNAIRDWLRHRGRFSVATGDALSSSDRSKFARTLNSLRDKGKIGMTEQYIWLLHE